MTPEMHAGFGTVDALKKFRDDLEAGFGEETEPVEEKTLEHQGFDIYTRTARWTKSSAPVVMQWTFDNKRRIAGFFVRQAPAAAESRFLDYQTKAALRLPFEGGWSVYWGGRTIEQNYHAADRGAALCHRFRHPPQRRHAFWRPIASRQLFLLGSACPRSCRGHRHRCRR